MKKLPPHFIRPPRDSTWSTTTCTEHSPRTLFWIHRRISVGPTNKLPSHSSVGFRGTLWDQGWADIAVPCLFVDFACQSSTSPTRTFSHTSRPSPPPQIWHFIMAVRSTAEEMERLQLSDEDTEDLWDSPSKRQTRQTFKQRSSEEHIAPEPRPIQDNSDNAFDREEAREVTLHHELQSVRNINEVLEGLLGSIDRAKGNMEVCPTFPIDHRKIYLTFSRLCQKQSHPPQLSSTLGPGSCHRPNTTNGSF